jgi:hypothetical protein
MDATTLPLDRNAPSVEMSYQDLVRVVHDRTVVVLVGFSGQGYKSPDVVERILAGLVKEFGDDAVFIAGATKDGIGMIYSLLPSVVEALGFHGVSAYGLVSECGRKYAASFGPCRGHVFIPDPDKTWDCVLPDGAGSANVDILRHGKRGVLVAIGGGPVACRELTEAIQKGREAIIFTGLCLAPAKPKAGATVLTVDGTLAQHLPSGAQVRSCDHLSV